MQLKKAYIALIAMVLMLLVTSGAYAQPGVNLAFGFLGAAGVNDSASTLTAETSDYTTTGAAIRVTGTVAIAGGSVTPTRLTLSFGVPITAAPPTALSATSGVWGCPGFGAGGTATPPIIFGTVTVFPAIVAGSNPVCPAIPTGGVPTQDPIRIYGQTGIFSGVSNVSIWSISYTGGTISVILPGLDPCVTLTTGAACTFTSGTTISTSTTTGTFLIEGIRLNLSGLAATTTSVTMTGALSGLANNYNLPTTTLAIINTIAPALGTVTQAAQATGLTNNGTATIFTNGVIGDSSATITVKEGYASAWRAVADYKRLNAAGGDVANATQIRLTFTGIPTGVTLGLGVSTSGATSVTDTSGSATASPVTKLAGSFSPGSVNALTTSSLFTCSNCGSQTAIDSFAVAVTASFVSSSTSVAAGTITVTASMAPVGTAFDSNTLPTQSDGFPKFLAVESGTGGPATAGPVVVNIIAASTNLLVPFVYVGPGGFDTGIEVANTTLDPFGAANGGAVAASGNLTVTLYPTAADGSAGTPVVYTTSSTAKAGYGLSTNGTLASGAVWTVAGSQLLPATTTQFVGYAFIQANFLNAHGTSTISDYRTYSLATNVLAIPPPLSFSRAATLEGGISGTSSSGSAGGLGF